MKVWWGNNHYPATLLLWNLLTTNKIYPYVSYASLCLYRASPKFIFYVCVVPLLASMALCSGFEVTERKVLFEYRSILYRWWHHRNRCDMLTIALNTAINTNACQQCITIQAYIIQVLSICTKLTKFTVIWDNGWIIWQNKIFLYAFLILPWFTI